MKPTMYQICVRGRLTERLAAVLEGMTCTLAPSTRCSPAKSKTSRSFTDSSTGCAISASNSSACNRRPEPVGKPTRTRPLMTQRLLQSERGGDAACPDRCPKGALAPGASTGLDPPGDRSGHRNRHGGNRFRIQRTRYRELAPGPGSVVRASRQRVLDLVCRASRLAAGPGDVVISGAIPAQFTRVILIRG